MVSYATPAGIIVAKLTVVIDRRRQFVIAHNVDEFLHAQLDFPLWQVLFYVNRNVFLDLDR